MRAVVVPSAQEAKRRPMRVRSGAWRKALHGPSKPEEAGATLQGPQDTTAPTAAAAVDGDPAPAPEAAGRAALLPLLAFAAHARRSEVESELDLPSPATRPLHLLVVFATLRGPKAAIRNAGGSVVLTRDAPRRRAEPVLRPPVVPLLGLEGEGPRATVDAGAGAARSARAQALSLPDGPTLAARRRAFPPTTATMPSPASALGEEVPARGPVSQDERDEVALVAIGQAAIHAIAWNAKGLSHLTPVATARAGLRVVRKPAAAASPLGTAGYPVAELPLLLRAPPPGRHELGPAIGAAARVAASSSGKPANVLNVLVEVEARAALLEVEVTCTGLAASASRGALAATMRQGARVGKHPAPAIPEAHPRPLGASNVLLGLLGVEGGRVIATPAAAVGERVAETTLPDLA